MVVKQRASYSFGEHIKEQNWNLCSTSVNSADVAKSSFPSRCASENQHLCPFSACTWRNEEGPPELFVACDISDLLRHVDEPAGHRRDAPKVQDPTGQRHILKGYILPAEYNKGFQTARRASQGGVRENWREIPEAKIPWKGQLRVFYKKQEYSYCTSAEHSQQLR